MVRYWWRAAEAASRQSHAIGEFLGCVAAADNRRHYQRNQADWRGFAGPADNAGMQGKRVLLGVTGGIAAYKSPDLVRRLREQGAEVQVVLTSGAREFVTAMTFQAVSG